MQQSEPIKPKGAYISDHRTLVDLSNAIRYTGQSVLRLREAVDGYFKAVERAMDDKIAEFRTRLARAREVLSAAQSALSACRERRYYDDEKDEWVEPNCSCEEREVRQAQKEVDRLEKIIEKLERIQSEVGSELYTYREPMGIVSPGGGDGVLEWLGDTHTQSATERMQRILEIVEKYLRVNIRDYGTPVYISDTPADAGFMGRSDSEDRKDLKFRKGIERIQQRQRDENYGDRELVTPGAVAICAGCHRPQIVCTCGRDSLERQQIFNYDFSR